MITEKIVSKKTAKLAKKKGFNWSSEEALYRVRTTGTECVFEYRGEFEGMENIYELIAFLPSQTILQKWLREEHNIDAIPYLVEMRSNDREISQKFEDKGYLYRLYKDGIGHYESFDKEMNYEQALEKGLQEALKLI